MISEQKITQLEKQLALGVEQLGLTLKPEQNVKIINYISMLTKWNRAFNLTAVRDPREMLVMHVLDSLSVAPYIEGKHALDVGSGAGLPGLILAIYDPSIHWVLLDSNGKKTRFLLQAAAELKLDNVRVEQERIESLQSEQPFDTIISRAFSDLNDFIDKTNHLKNQKTTTLAMKGLDPKDELTTIAQHGKVHALKVPYLDQQRHVVVIKGN